ncbi:hypothetical protein J6TS2_27030 [Heyndrickxia sporothermodurans]|nr:hypothetical protein J6TS2_27030 [Heyndrickxia sporothermodurans]
MEQDKTETRNGPQNENNGPQIEKDESQIGINAPQTVQDKPKTRNGPQNENNGLQIEKDESQIEIYILQTKKIFIKEFAIRIWNNKEGTSSFPI